MPTTSSHPLSTRRAGSTDGRLADLAGLLEAISACALLARDDGVVVLSNQALRSLHPPADRTRPAARLHDLLSQGDVARLLAPEGASGVRTRILDGNGASRDFEWSARRLRTAESGEFSLVIGRDAEQERKLEDHIIEQQWFETAAALSGGLAHDFNNVLAAILGLSEIISLRLPSDSPLQEYTRKIGESVDRAKQLVRRFSQFSRKGTGVIDAQPTAMLLTDLTRLLAGFLPGSVTFSTAIDPDTPWCHADRHALEQIVINCTNFLRNRLRDENGQITLGAHGSSDGRHAIITLRGSGQGLLGVDVESQFALSLAPSATAYESRTGLHTARALAMRQSATLRVDREDPRTVIFVLEVPVAPELEG